VARFEPWTAGPAAHLVEALERDLLLGLLEPRPGERLLEVGCGRGRRLAIFRNRGLDVMGLESVPALIEAARRKLGPDLVQAGDLDDLPWDDNAFDLVLLGNCLAYVKNPESALGEAGRVARRRVVVEMVNPYSWLGLKIRFYDDDPPPRWLGPWRLKNLAEQVFGPSPVRTLSLLTFPQSWLPWLKHVETSPFVQRQPWGGLYFLAIDLRYTLRADPLTARAKPAPLGPAAGPLRYQPPPPRMKRSDCERSLFV